jgi:hypothetical protein
MANRRNFLKLFGGGTLLPALSPEVITQPKIDKCEVCDNKLVTGKCLHTKYCSTCKAWKHFPEDKCETCNNGDIQLDFSKLPRFSTQTACDMYTSYAVIPSKIREM